MPTEEQTYRSGIVDSLTRIENKVTYTNGKVRKIIIGMALLTGAMLDQLASSHATLFALLSHLF